ncbi:ABC transporter permease [Paraburkholderia sp. BR13444]|uniref:ABC transporter permease n=1 Tax=Paraburkholderia sp. BR13444 TaxID=3236997 RepID=UPI0034CD7338
MLTTEGWGRQLLSGALLSVELALCTLPFGLCAGLLLARGQDSEGSGVARFCTALVTIFRALPELLTIFIVYYGGQIALQKLLPLVAITSPVEINGFLAGMLALTLVFGAFSSEVFKAALHAVPRGQHEAAHALGLSGGKAFVSVVFPQMWRVALPGLGNLWLVLLKDTSLVSVIALPDLIRQANLAVSATREPFFFYLAAFLIYLVASIISGQGLSRLEIRANRPYMVIGK